MKTTLAIVSTAIALAVPSVSQAAAKTWLEIKSPHFTVLSTDTERSARNLAWEFEQVRAVAENLWPWAKVRTDRPVTIMAVPDEEEMKVLVPQFFEKGASRPVSVLCASPEGYFITLRSDVRAGNKDGINPYLLAYWNYLTLVLRASVPVRLPAWFALGMTDIFSNTLVHDNELQIGRMHPQDVRQLQQQARMSPRELIDLGYDSSWYKDPARRGTLEATAGLFLHLLLFADETGARARLVDQYVDRLVHGMSSMAAFQEVFGPPEQYEIEFAKYINRPLLTYRRVPVDARVTRDRLAARTLSQAEVLSALANLHISSGRTTEAKAEIEAARIAGAPATIIDELSGLRFDSDDAAADAAASYERAAGHGSTNFYVYYRLATLKGKSSPDGSLPADVEPLLERTIALNADYAPAYLMLSDVKMQRHQMGEALDLAKKAAGLDPSSFAAQLLLARALAGNSLFTEALMQARRAELSADQLTQHQDVEALTKRVIADAIASLPPLPPPFAIPDGAVRIGGSMKQPVKTRNVSPVYPDLAQAALAEGIVILQALVGADGHVLGAQVLRSQPLLDRAAIDAVRQWEYEPTLVNGAPAPVVMTVTLSFSLR